MRHGAYDYLNKPFDLDEVALCVEKALETSRLAQRGAGVPHHQAQGLQLRHHHRPVGGDGHGHGPARAHRGESGLDAAYGETGTGKDLVAKVVPYQRSRGEAVREHHVLGAAGAAARERALRPRARRVHRSARSGSGGFSRSPTAATVFLDEIGEIRPGCRPKLLRFLEEKTFKRVGGRTDIRWTSGSIAATNPDLKRSGPRGKIRETCFYRLQRDAGRAAAARGVHAATVPPTRAAVRGAVQPGIPAKRSARDADAIAGSEQTSRGRATYASSATRSNQRCCSSNATALTLEDFSALPGAARGATSFKPAAGRASTSKAWSVDPVLQALDAPLWNETHAARLLGINRDRCAIASRSSGCRRGPTAGAAALKA